MKTNYISNELSELRELNINNTNISNLPDDLINLEILLCKNSNIHSIPKLYTNLISLDCSNTNILSLTDINLKGQSMEKNLCLIVKCIIVAIVVVAKINSSNNQRVKND